MAELRQAFHRLAGSGGSYGFPVVSTQSREGERLARQLELANAALTPSELGALGAAVEMVAHAFEDALRSPDSGSLG